MMMFSENYSSQTALASVQKALDPNLTDRELASMARADEVKVRAAVAERADTPVMTLLKLSRDPSPAVRAGVASNPSPDVPEDLFLELASDKAPEVVFALIYNHAVPRAVIAKLARQIHKKHSGAARARLASASTGPSDSAIVGIATKR
ncbi:hypothetical protein ACNI3K_13000 [Demequina sp. SO4-13]|uniref:hypothetical protein n=1 Tax=Demequina sp. SO4-13 TaxID=3401027 RepID=UPI003AF9E903